MYQCPDMPCELPGYSLDGLDLLTLCPFLVLFELPLLSAQAVIRGEESGQKARPDAFRNHTSVQPPLAVVVRSIAPSLPRHHTLRRATFVRTPRLGCHHPRRMRASPFPP